jgi:branched-chain amino acid transport system ATP-binding protein
MLSVEALETAYGPVRALDDVSFEVAQGSITAVLGANGAGKTSLLRTLSGLVRAQAGLIRLDGRSIGDLPVETIVRLGMAHVPEGRGVITELSVDENLRLGGLWRGGGGRDGLADVHELFPRLRERATQKGGTLSGGEQQMLAIGRALMARPTLLLLDEPSMGLSPILVETIFDIIRNINQLGTTILLVEQNARMALRVAHRGYVIQTGRIVLQDAASSLLRSDLVRKVYLGEK